MSENRSMNIKVQFACNKIKYHANITFSSHEAMLEAAGESVTRILQQRWGRKGKFPTDRIVDVDERGEFQKSAEDTLSTLNEEQFKEFYEAVMKLQAKKNADIAAMVQDEPKTIKTLKSA